MQYRTALPVRRRTDRQDRLGEFLPGPHPFHRLGPVGELTHRLRGRVRADGPVILVPPADPECALDRLEGTAHRRAMAVRGLLTDLTATPDWA